MSETSSLLFTINNIHKNKYEKVNLNSPFIFLIGVFSSFYVKIIGEFYISEIILIIIFPFLILKIKQQLLNPWFKRVLIFGYLWFFNQVITDFVRNTNIFDLARGWSSIVVLLFTFVSLYLLLQENFHRIKIYIFGVCIGGLIEPFIQPSPFFIIEPWKFGFGIPITFLVILFLVTTQNIQFKKKYVQFIILLFLGILSFYLNARSIGAFVILTAIILLLIRLKFVKRYLNGAFHLKKLIISIILLISIIFGIIRSYGIIVENGVLGESARIKYQLQSSGKLGLLLGGRVEILSSLQAIKDSPIIGYGSWAKDSSYREYLFLLYQLGYDFSSNQIRQNIESSELIPAHSHLFQNWIWAGIIGALFWIVISLLIIKSFLLSIKRYSTISILVIYLTIFSGWDILFSPYGSFMRLTWALRLVVFISTLYIKEDNILKEKHENIYCNNII